LQFINDRPDCLAALLGAIVARKVLTDGLKLVKRKNFTLTQAFAGIVWSRYAAFVVLASGSAWREHGQLA
jgi:hypothetical protein